MKDQDPFDFFKITKAKEAVDISVPTLRQWARQGGIRLYKVGKFCFASRSEVAEFIRKRGLEVAA